MIIPSNFVHNKVMKTELLAAYERSYHNELF